MVEGRPEDEEEGEGAGFAEFPVGEDFLGRGGEEVLQHLTDGHGHVDAQAELFKHAAVDLGVVVAAVGQEV